MVDEGAIITGLAVGAGVLLLGGLVRDDQPSPSGMLENLRITIQEGQQKQAEKEGERQGPSNQRSETMRQKAAVRREQFQEGNISVAGGGDPGPAFNEPVNTVEEAQKPLDTSNIAVAPDPATGTKEATAASAQRIAAKEIVGSGFQGDFI